MEVHKQLREEVLDQVERDAVAVAHRMAAASRAEVAEYGALPDPTGQLEAHAEQHVRVWVRCARSGRPPAGRELDFVRERGAQRARELLQLDALLEAYMVSQRTLWEAICEAAGDSVEGLEAARALTALAFEYIRSVNLAVTAAFVRENQAVATEHERLHRDLVDWLLAGRPLGEEQARRAEALGLRPDGEHFVVVARARDGGDGTALRLAARALAVGEPTRPFLVQRDEELIAVLPVYARHGPREARAAIATSAERLHRTRGVELRAGLSTVCSGLDQVARGYSEASRALAYTGPVGAAAIEEIGLLDLLAAGADGTARRLVPPDVRRLAVEDESSGGALIATLRAYADSHLNVARAAEALTVHPNTVHYRLRRVTELTGRDPRHFDDLVELLLADRLLGAGERRG